MPLQATSGAASQDAFGGNGVAVVPTYIEDVFSTYLYTGNGSTQTITNNIDLSTKGGLTWIKGRSGATNHAWYDTARGATKDLVSNSTAAETTQSTGLTSFGSTGFSLGALAKVNTNAATYASWTFRKQPKFFDVVTYTGTGTAGLTVSHNLGATPGVIIVKRTDGATNWRVYHRSLGATQYLDLDETYAAGTATTVWNDTAPTSTVFSVGTNSGVNASGGTYVAYLFAHDAGGFGLTGTDNVISCGSYTGTGSGEGPQVNLGYEPQWLLIKNVTGGASMDWWLFDSMRGMTVFGGNDADLRPNSSQAEENAVSYVNPNATGFTTGGATALNQVQTYIYIAIRRGPMKVPTSGTSVFTPYVIGSTPPASYPSFISGFPVDLGIRTYQPGGSSYYPWWSDRLRGKKYLISSSTSAEGGFGVETFDFMNGWGSVGATNEVSWMFRRAPSFFDEVCYTGDSTLGRAVPHNLAAVPEMMIVKNRNNTENWVVYSTATGATKSSILNSTAAASVRAVWANTTPTSTNFYVGGSGVLGETNYTSYTYVAYLFATCAGVSKVGSYTGTGTTKQVDCGFAAGARFVLIKRTDSTGDWYVWDSARGIVAGNDPYLLLNTTAAEVTSTDYIDTYSAGFEITSTAPAAINASGGSFIFLAIS